MTPYVGLRFGRDDAVCEGILKSGHQCWVLMPSIWSQSVAVWAR
jgi:hypothetical protein